ncbi:peptidoglycan D,D-transpeptidase FtsI family protein [Actinomyces timonensis]|uniref:peptidoglycan D,D-transpeptidase FtsI family protein n=1 Tax=Actinomyces timonensis TaxID=1288391 RepID=UPI0002F65A50|nr:penicillin-binding protein 2 [Actinomyces timonensis]
MNRQIHQVAVLVTMMFLALAVSVTSVQGFARPAVWEAESSEGSLTTDWRNQRAAFAAFGAHRGQILVAGSPVASSQASDDVYSYQRVYSSGPLYAQVTGYSSPMRSELTGMEKSENGVLNGDDPSLFSSRVKALITGASQEGGSVDLTINAQAQQAASNALGGRRGAVVALDPSTGAVLALVSSPSFDPNTLASHDADTVSAAWDQYSADPGQPLVNRATGGDLYPPGSTFKILTTSAALRAGKVTTSTSLDAPDSITLPGTSHSLFNYRGESCGNGTVTLSTAFAQSCNTPFAQLAMDVGDDGLAKEAEAWGFGTKDDFSLPVTASTYPANSSAAETAMAGIGQQSVRVTPLQMAQVAATVANDGKQMKPYLVARTLDADLSVVSTTSPEVARTPIDAKTAETLTGLMQEAVSSGTGTTAQVAGVQVAGKTGTAETGSDEGGPVTWFVGFAGTDINKPSIALAVVIDGGQQTSPTATGGSEAGPIAAAVIDAAVNQ